MVRFLATLDPAVHNNSQRWGLRGEQIGCRQNFVLSRMKCAVSNAGDSKVRKEFRQISWDSTLKEDCRELLRLARREDLGAGGDCTTMALVPDSATARA